jgi:eukaryotic-like serine/threonine-protein kinase
MGSRPLTSGDVKWSGSATSGTQYLAEPQFVMPFERGQVVGRKYEIIDMLGMGGVGFVVAANHIELGEKVALKFLKPEMLVNPEVVGRFAHEALAAVRIKSEHVARVFDVGSLPDGTPFIVMEFLEGRDLFDVILQDGPQPVRRAVDFLLQACEALADAHSCGVVHRDIKPENLFLLQRSEGIELIKVLDFGISKLALTGSAIKSKVPLIRTMLPMGSPVYMSPEQIRASKDIDCRTDIWSIGCVLYELLTGKAAFDAPSLTQLSATILEQHPNLPSAEHPEIPKEIDAIVAKCLEKNPKDRYQNVAELAMALYPFGPRRARVHAERCCLLLKVAGSNRAEFELPSVRPPNWDGVSSGSFPTTKPIVTPVQVPDIVADEVNPFAPKRRNKIVAIVALCVVALAAAAAFGLSRTGSQESDAAATRNPKASQPNAQLKPAEPSLAAVVPKPRAASEGSTSAPSAQGATEATASATQLAAPTNLNGQRRNVVSRAPRPKKSTESGPANPNPDPDPGF